MILSTRPTDRRQLIEEAAGVTKYKARRRSAELKLEAAQQNLTRIDDIVFEVEKQRGTLKRQAGKARRYQRLRDELRRWEKVLFARKYRQLAETIESARGAPDRGARARVGRRGARRRGRSPISGGCASSWSRPSRTSTASREAAHARELAINRQEQQIAFDREQVAGARGADGVGRGRARGARSAPRAGARGARRRAARRRPTANAERDRAAATLASESEALRDGAPRDRRPRSRRRSGAQRGVFGASTRRPRCGTRSSTRRPRATAVAETLSKLDVETERRPRSSRSASRRIAARRPTACAARTTRSRRRASRGRRANRSWPARASSTNGARRSVRSREHELAGLEARLQVARGARRRARRLRRRRAHRAGRRRTARSSQQGAIADYLEVEAGYERAVEACLGDLLQHVVVERPEHAAAGFQLVREAGAGRCGFLVDVAVGAGATGGFRADERHRRRRADLNAPTSRPAARRCPTASSRCRRSSASTARSPARSARPSARRGSRSRMTARRAPAA